MVAFFLFWAGNSALSVAIQLTKLLLLLHKNCCCWGYNSIATVLLLSSYFSKFIVVVLDSIGAVSGKIKVNVILNSSFIVFLAAILLQAGYVFREKEFMKNKFDKIHM